jgi:hypothetical protein
MAQCEGQILLPETEWGPLGRDFVQCPRKTLRNLCVRCEIAAGGFRQLIPDTGRLGRIFQILYDRDVAALVEDWHDDASEAALAGRPEWAGYIEKMLARLHGEPAPKLDPRLI